MEGWTAEGGGALYVKVMTDEQMEFLRKQIAAYANISEKLVQMHRAVMTQQDSISGMRLSGLYSDPLMSPGGVKIPGRQRWTPTTIQLQILESIFNQRNGAPSKQRIKEITAELAQHGQISEANVQNWFQNRRARSKKKKTRTAILINTESNANVESLNNKKAKTEEIVPYGNLSLAVDDHSSQSPHVSSYLSFLEQDPNGSQGLNALHDISKFSGFSDKMLVYGNSLSTPMFYTD